MTTDELLKIKIQELEQVVGILKDRIEELEDFLKFEKRLRKNDVEFWKHMYKLQKQHTEGIIETHNELRPKVINE